MRAVGGVLALIGGFGLVLTMGVFVLSSVCWEYCEDEPTSAVLGGLLTWAAVALWQATGGGPLGGIGLLGAGGRVAVHDLVHGRAG
jgi:hypothetical protein